MTKSTESFLTDPATRVGHVHLKVADLERAIAFYRDVMGFELQQRFGTEAAFLGAGGYHHHIGLNTWHSRNAPPAPTRSAGLYHVAFLYPDRAALARTLRRVLDCGVKLDGAADHGVSEALYFRDPDDNGIEIYRDRAPEDWPRDVQRRARDGERRLDVEALLAEAG